MGRNQAEALGAEGRKDAFPFDPDKLVLVEDPAHPLYDERVHLPVPAWLVESVRTYGVLQAITVRKNGETEKGDPIVEVVIGRQRVKAARIANQELRAEGKPPVFVYALVKNAKDGEIAEIAVVENEHRQDDDPMTRARKMQRLVDLGRPLERVALAFKCKAKEVRAALGLLELDDKVQDAVERQQLSPSVAAELREFPRAVQRAKLKEMVAAGATRGEAARATIRGESTAGRKSNKARMRSRALVEQLARAVNGEAGAMLRFVLGDDAALDGHPEMREAAVAGGWKATQP